MVCSAPMLTPSAFKLHACHSVGIVSIRHDDNGTVQLNHPEMDSVIETVGGIVSVGA